jgi:metal-responsive CopG/Arc/MetJ family transcriptional regulator
MIHSMETIQVVLEEGLLREADRAARRLKVNRSVLVRQALRAHLDQMRRDRLERADREGYERTPDHGVEMAVWEGVATWPDE